MVGGWGGALYLNIEMLVSGWKEGMEFTTACVLIEKVRTACLGSVTDWHPNVVGSVSLMET